MTLAYADFISPNPTAFAQSGNPVSLTGWSNLGRLALNATYAAAGGGALTGAKLVYPTAYVNPGVGTGIINTGTYPGAVMVASGYLIGGYAASTLDNTSPISGVVMAINNGNAASNDIAVPSPDSATADIFLCTGTFAQDGTNGSGDNFLLNVDGVTPITVADWNAASTNIDTSGVGGFGVGGLGTNRGVYTRNLRLWCRISYNGGSNRPNTLRGRLGPLRGRTLGIR